MHTKLQSMVLVSAASLLLATALAHAQVAIIDIGTNAPTPGSNDISQLTTVGDGVPGLNYYWDNGSAVGAAAGSPPAFIGQTFTTGNSPQGYVLSSVAFQTYCCGHGGSAQGCSYLQSQSFTLNIYQISGTNLTDATLLNSFIATGQLQADGDWMQWDGLAVALAPGTNYAWAFGISATNACDNWEPLSTASGWPYTNGQACEIIDPGGPGSVIYSSVVNQYDAVFDIGLTIPSAPVAGTPFESPSYANSGVAAGTDVTLTASAAGRQPIFYQWQTDGGLGGALTNIPGATGSNLVVNTTGWVPGTYVYDFVAVNSYGTNTGPTVNIVIAQITLTDIGVTAPTPGTNDITQFSTIGNEVDPGGLSYFWDSGETNGEWIGQSFTTLNDPNGYLLTSLALRTAGLGDGGGNYLGTQPFSLYLYQLSGTDLTNATLLETYTAISALKADGDWMLWHGLGTALAPNTSYAWGFGVSSPPDDWENLSVATNLPYSGGQICMLPTGGGTVVYASPLNTWDATFDIGLTIILAPIAGTPLASPSYASSGAPAGTDVTLTASAAGQQPISYQWQTDGGLRGALTNIPGATGSNLVVNTTGWALGTYVYDFVAVNSYGTNTSPTVNIVIAQITLATLTDIGGTAPTPGSNDISQFTTVGYGVPGLNYYWDNGSAVGAAAGSPPAFIGQTFTTGNNPQGYFLSSVAFQTYCCGQGGSEQGCSYLQSQAFTLNIYQISGTNLTDATLVNSFVATGQLQADGDWMLWNGLGTALAPNTNYAWAFGIAATSGCDNWEPLSTATGWPYTGGQACEIIDPGGPGSVIYSSLVNQYDAVFNIGLSLPVELNIARAAGKNLTVTWPQGTLLQSTNLLGPWTTNTAASPYTIQPSNSQMFFKALLQ